MADEEKAEAGDKPKAAAPSDGGDMLAVLRDIRDAQRESTERQGRFMWLLIPIFALLCIQVVLLLFH